MLSISSALTEALTRRSLERPLRAGLTVAALSVFFAFGAGKLTTDAGFRSYLGDEHPAVRKLDAFIERFGGGLPAGIVWSCGNASACESALDPVSLEMASAVSERLGRVPGVRRVESPATSPLIVPSRDGIAVRRLVEGGKLARDLGALREWALRDPFWRGRLVSEDGRVGAIVLQLASSDSAANSAVVDAMMEELERYEQRGFELYLVGDPVEFVVAAQDLERDARRLVPAMMVLIWLVIYLLFRSWRWALACLATVSVALLWTFGTMGWLGWPQTAVSQALGPFVLVIGVCDAIHLLSRLASESPCTVERMRPRLIDAARLLSRPCVFTSATTAGGFLSFAGSGIQSFERFGILAALGVFYALLLTFSLLPLLLLAARETGPARRSLERVWSRAPVSLVDGVARRPWTITACAVAVTAIAALGLLRLDYDIDIAQVFGEQSRVVRWLRFAEKHLHIGGALEIELVLPESLAESEDARRTVAEISAWLPTVPGLTGAESVLDLANHAREMIASNSAGRSNRAVGEMLFLLSLHDPVLLDQWLSLDGKRVRISAEARQSSAVESRRLITEVEEYLNATLPQGVEHRITGAFSVQHDMVSEVHRVQLTSFAIAWVVVTFLLGVFLRSVRLALLGMFPTTVPVLLTLGAMGAWGIPLDIGTAMVGAVVLGIAVDDVIHLLEAYRRYRLAGEAREPAIRGAVQEVGRALVTTSLALALGFFTMTVSSWESVASFGLLSGIAILVALVADLVLIPATVLAVERVSLRRANGAGAPWSAWL